MEPIGIPMITVVDAAIKALKEERPEQVADYLEMIRSALDPIHERPRGAKRGPRKKNKDAVGSEAA